MGFKSTQHGLNKDLPFEKNEFDLATILNALHLVKKSEICLEEVHRVLRTGGYLILTVPHIGFIRCGLLSLLGKRPMGERGKGKARYFTKSYLENVLRESGFKIEEWNHKLIVPLLPRIRGKLLGTIFPSLLSNRLAVRCRKMKEQ